RQQTDGRRSGLGHSGLTKGSLPWLAGGCHRRGARRVWGGPAVLGSPLGTTRTPARAVRMKLVSLARSALQGNPRGPGVGVNKRARRDVAADCRCDGLFSPGIGKSLATTEDRSPGLPRSASECRRFSRQRKRVGGCPSGGSLWRCL